MLQVESLHKSYGAQTLFEQIQFKVNKGERIGLVGRNGHGKTTLLRIITGHETADSGNVIIPKGYRIGFVRQHLEFTKDTIIKEAMLGLTEQEADQRWKAEKILAGLGFSVTDMNRPPSDFSGGFQVRLNLAKVLISEPDMLLLDEPTNYLDITSIRWVQQFLKTWLHELILVTHDRGFMDQVVTHTLGIYRKTVRKIKGNTEKYYSQIAQEEEIYEKTRLNDERRKKEIALFISRFRAKARLAGLVQSRIKMIERMEKRDKLEAMHNLEFSLRSKPFQGKYVMIVEDLTFGYNSGPDLFQNLNFTVNPGDRICIIGKNGKGKTTLIKLLGLSLQPRRGEVNVNPNITMGFYEQTNIASLIDSRTVEEEILYSTTDTDRQTARNICGAMMFEGNLALKRIAVLSGGEKSRVMLGKILATPVNLLLLDEPTNHLDMESCDALLAALDNFNGTVIMVTHNEMFLHAMANRLLVFSDEGVFMFEGSYGEFLEKDGWHESAGQDEISVTSSTPPSVPKTDKKLIKRLRSELINERSRAIKPIEKQIEQAEADIERCEKVINQLNRDMQHAAENKDGTRIMEISQSLHAYQAEIDRLFYKLEDFTVTLETQSAIFDEKLKTLD